jgi:hypothetical protein
MVQFKKETTIKTQSLIEIDDWNPNLGSRNIFSFWFTVPNLPQQEIDLPFWEIAEYQMQKRKIDSYFDTGDGMIVVDCGVEERYCQVDDALHTSAGKKIIYTYQEYIKEHMSDAILIDFVSEIMNEYLPTEAVSKDFEPFKK